MKFALAAVALLSWSTAAFADLNCENTSGLWTGTMQGRFNGPTAMTIGADCRVTWTLPDGRINNCRFTNRGTAIEYSCSLGSRGSVAFQNGSIIMQNIYTAAQHGAYTVTVSRVSR